jgi:hypothetical protein
MHAQISNSNIDFARGWERKCILSAAIPGKDPKMEPPMTTIDLFGGRCHLRQLCRAQEYLLLPLSSSEHFSMTEHMSCTTHRPQIRLLKILALNDIMFTCSPRCRSRSSTVDLKRLWKISNERKNAIHDGYF